MSAVGWETCGDDRSCVCVDSAAPCCGARSVDQCVCLQRVGDLKLAGMLKERVERRRDLSVGAQGALLAAILNLMQHLQAAPPLPPT
ncbi:hypothetical protein ACOMHN_047381 [Nucella lapillus]